MAHPIPSSDEFVVRAKGEAGEALRRQAKGLGALESLQGSDQGLEVLRLKDSPGEPRTAWAQVCRALGPAMAVAPVLRDENGRALYPTGRITVRFERTPAEDELTHFAERHRLRLRERNKHAPTQVVFEAATAPEVFPPDLVEQIAKSPGVRAAWLETLSAYRRL